MYKMYIKEELQSTLISMLVETGQQKGAFFFKSRSLGNYLSVKGYLHVNVGFVLSHLVAYSMKVELTGSYNLFSQHVKSYFICYKSLYNFECYVVSF